MKKEEEEASKPARGGASQTFSALWMFGKRPKMKI
jgi:hypothetical protein